MKKIFALLLAAVMVLSMVACGENKPTESTPETTVPPTTEPAPVAESALEILETVWAQFGEDEKFFVMGGDFDNMVDGAPGKATNTDFFSGNLLVPADQIANITDAAAMTHGMNANTFTGAAYAVADAKAFATAMQTAIQGNQWICGFPEKMLIVTLSDDYAVVAFGSADIVDNFGTKLADSYETAETVVDAPLA